MEQSKLLEILNSYNKFWATGAVEAGIPREVLARCARELNQKEILLLKGVRRSGKSTLMAQMIRVLLEKGKNPNQLLRVNLEEPLFAAEYSIELLEQIYRVYREKVCPSGKCTLFLDEIQNIPEWERWVRGRSETENLKIIITGSSSRLLSREVGARLTGRHVSFEIFPLSFPEFLRFKGVTMGSEGGLFRAETGYPEPFFRVPEIRRLSGSGAPKRARRQGTAAETVFRGYSSPRCRLPERDTRHPDASEPGHLFDDQHRSADQHYQPEKKFRCFPGQSGKLHFGLAGKLPDLPAFEIRAFLKEEPPGSF